MRHIVKLRYPQQKYIRSHPIQRHTHIYIHFVQLSTLEPQGRLLREHALQQGKTHELALVQDGGNGRKVQRQVEADIRVI